MEMFPSKLLCFNLIGDFSNTLFHIIFMITTRKAVQWLSIHSRNFR